MSGRFDFLAMAVDLWSAAPRHAPEARASQQGRGRPLQVVVSERLDTPGAEDAQIVERIRAGDRVAFDELIRRYSTGLQQFLVSRVDSVPTAEDLLQDLFLRIWRQREQWNVRQSLRLYLYVAARNAAAIYRRHARIVDRTAVEAVRNDEAPGMGAGSGLADRQTELGEVSAAVRQAVEQLPSRSRQVAALRLYDELTYAEIAETMGITVKAVEGLFARALFRLRRQLAGYL